MISAAAFTLSLLLAGATVSQVSSRPVLILVFDSINPSHIDQMPNLDKGGDWGQLIARPRMLKSENPTTAFSFLHTVATGVLPDVHGVISNVMFDKQGEKMFNIAEQFQFDETIIPIWTEAVQKGKKTATYLWPAADFSMKNVLPLVAEKYTGLIYPERRSFSRAGADSVNNSTGAARGLSSASGHGFSASVTGGNSAGDVGGHSSAKRLDPTSRPSSVPIEPIDTGGNSTGIVRDQRFSPSRPKTKGNSTGMVSGQGSAKDLDSASRFGSVPSGPIVPGGNLADIIRGQRFSPSSPKVTEGNSTGMVNGQGSAKDLDSASRFGSVPSGPIVTGGNLTGIIRGRRFSPSSPKVTEGNSTGMVNGQGSAKDLGSVSIVTDATDGDFAATNSANSSATTDSTVHTSKSVPPATTGTGLHWSTKIAVTADESVATGSDSEHYSKKAPWSWKARVSVIKNWFQTENVEFGMAYFEDNDNLEYELTYINKVYETIQNIYEELKDLDVDIITMTRGKKSVYRDYIMVIDDYLWTCLFEQCKFITSGGISFIRFWNNSSLEKTYRNLRERPEHNKKFRVFKRDDASMTEWNLKDFALLQNTLILVTLGNYAFYSRFKDANITGNGFNKLRTTGFPKSDDDMNGVLFLKGQSFKDDVVAQHIRIELTEIYPLIKKLLGLNERASDKQKVEDLSDNMKELIEDETLREWGLI